MLDIRQIRENPDQVNQALKRRNPNLSVDAILAIDIDRRKLLQEEEALRNERNQLSKAVGQKKKNGENADEELARSKDVADRIKAIESEKTELEEKQQTLLLDIPNMPLAATPDGLDESANVELRSWGDGLKSRAPDTVVDHWEVGEALGILDFERGVKLAKSRFSLVRGGGSQMVRALINFMLDTHTSMGYEEVLPPFMVNRQALTGTGQLPKFEEDVFCCTADDLFLIPTAEVPVTNIYAGEILDESDLPMNFCAYTPCFRREAGSAGKDTRGLIRQHQFDKVELVMLAHPEQSEELHQKLIAQAERILQMLELPYRSVELCAGDLGFSAARCVDLEVWMPAQKVYREISSCSNFLDYQARRIGLKFRPGAGDDSSKEAAKGSKTRYLHTLNGSGLAVGRTLAAILENYQVSPTEVTIPEVLRPYFRDGKTTLTVSEAAQSCTVQ